MSALPSCDPSSTRRGSRIIRLIKLDNVICTTHLGVVTLEASERGQWGAPTTYFLIVRRSFSLIAGGMFRKSSTMV
jgi:phosphoglycerate dehydrogenase-like enzyme